MSIYSSLCTTLLAAVIATPMLATAGPISNFLMPSTYPVKTISKSVSASVNINTADAETLAAELKGIGPKLARAILAYRKEHGPFKSVEDLKKVRGVGKYILEKNHGKIIV